MSDDKETPVKPVAPANGEAQAEQVVPTDDGTTPPQTDEEKEEKLLAGKFKNPEELEKSYQEAQSKLTQLAQENSVLKSQQVPEEGYPPTEPSELDPSVVPALDSWYQDRRERERTDEFIRKHTEELEDPVLAGTVQRLITEANSNNKRLDQEEALTQAKKLLDERIKPQVKEAQTQGEREGAKVAQEKAKLGNVGETPSAQKIDTEKLSADEYAKYYNLPRA